ncbi:MAG: zinc-dependent metalloprotease, partial [Rhodothermales bacterium]|nr:zinc-dependent metalloprotease [Rhodothermales bacterium]
KDDKKPPFKPWKDVLEDTKATDGFFKTHLKRDNTLYVEIPPARLDKEFGLVMHFSRGVGVFNLHDGLPLSDTRLMRFERHGDKIYLVHVNHRLKAAKGSPMENSLNDNRGNSIVSAFDIASEDSASKALLIDATSFFVSDYARLADQVKPYFNKKPVSFDKSRSYVDVVQGFPKNVEIDALLTLKANDPPAASSAGVSDFRSIPVGVRYSIFDLPENPMTPRLGDDRVGYFLDAVKDFSRDREYSPYVAYINRWRLEKKDPSAEISEPVKPIVYYVDRSVPYEYRKYVKAGIEAWNKGYEAAGFKNAIVAKDAPPDSVNWSAEDIRYSTVRWTAAHSMGYAIGPSQSDPRTGELLNADILISSTFVRGWANEYAQMIAPETMFDRYRAAEEAQTLLPPGIAERMCLAEMGKSHQLGLQHAALAALGVVDGAKPLPDEVLGEALKDLIMHEVGHTLGLRHNFKSSSAVPFDRLNDKDFVRKNGLATSVMDYNPTNIAVNPSEQGHYNNVEVGAYDVWAIQYGYSPTVVQGGTNGDSGSMAVPAEQEKTMLGRIASRAAEPLLAYNTDEDTHLGPMGVDPSSNAWDLSGDPMAFAQSRRELVDRIQPHIEERMIADGDAYSRLRGAVGRLVFERVFSTVPLTKTVGGLYFARDHKNDPNARDPFTPVSAARQREVMDFIADNVFDADAFEFDAELLNKLAPNRLSHWGTGYRSTPVDFPIHAMVAGGHAQILGELLDNGRLTRMIDNGVRTSPADVYTVSEFLAKLTTEIWTEVQNPSSPQAANSFRRNLQRMYVDHLTRIMLDVRPAPTSRPAPEDARSLARLELTELSGRIGQALQSSSLDRTMRAHLMESKVRIDEMLDVTMTVKAK